MTLQKLAIAAKYPGVCQGCGRRVSVGDVVDWSPTGHLVIACGKCRDQPKARAASTINRPARPNHPNRPRTIDANEQRICDAIRAGEILT